MKINYFKLVIAILICQLAGFLGSIFTSSSIPTWYSTLEKPFFNPPNWVFAPVWTTLFLLMGISLYIVWEKLSKTKKAKYPLIIFGIQLVLNILWSILFFGLKSPFYAFLEIIILWFAIILAILSFYRVSKSAAYLLIPYILWVSFAAVLNLFIYILNA